MLMLVLYDAAPTAVSKERLIIGIDTYGFKIPTEEFDKELHFACEAGCVKKEQATLSKGLTLYSLTVEGRDYLEGNGLV